MIQKVADPIVSEHFAKAGLGVVLIDQQHGLFVNPTILKLFLAFPFSGLLDERTSFECLQRLEKFPGCFPMVRVADNTPALIRCFALHLSQKSVKRDPKKGMLASLRSRLRSRLLFGVFFPI